MLKIFSSSDPTGKRKRAAYLKSTLLLPPDNVCPECHKTISRTNWSKHVGAKHPEYKIANFFEPSHYPQFVSGVEGVQEEQFGSFEQIPIFFEPSHHQQFVSGVGDVRFEQFGSMEQ
uniref:C2H2-type domain-containing protein n=1 Tax=Meloidogyne hapla TaxID=6305 RepID=A0A1I8B686_MELHA